MKHLSFLITFALLAVFSVCQSSAQSKIHSLTDPEPPKFELAVFTAPCVGGGTNLLVYNPFAKSVFSLSSSEYSVKWIYSKGNIFLTDKILLPCVCDGRFTAIVTHKHTGRQKSITIYVPPCDKLTAVKGNPR